MMNNKAFQDTKERILNAAIGIFVEKGKYGARMQKIANKAGINKAMIHYYFTDKDTLYEKSFEYIFKNIFYKVSKFLNKDIPFEKKLEKFIDTYLDYVSKNIEIPRLIFREIADGGEVLKRVMNKISTEDNVFFIPVKITEIMNEAKQEGEIREIDVKQTIISIVGMSIFYFIGRPIIDIIWDIKPEDFNDFIEKRKESIVDLILHGIKV